ncbi:MAG: hypothetical protein EKK40_09620 [Bradyrhizobiaceae bacterium]|nr:MAG: hypothetical protein EKK40_09620 [Bradyrhizobiaceae bacterium]
MKKIYRTDQSNKLFRDNDPPETTEAINVIRESGYFVERQRNNDHHLRIRKVNYYPTTGTITVDGQGKAKPKKGLVHLIELLLEMYPKKTRPPLLKQSAAQFLEGAFAEATSLDLSHAIEDGYKPDNETCDIYLMGAGICEDISNDRPFIDLEQERLLRFNRRRG